MQTTFHTNPFNLPVVPNTDQRKIIAPADFPVHWLNPEDEQHHWTRDREHTPYPITPMFLSIVAPCAGEGRGRVVERYAEAITGRADRLINGYNYTRYIVFSGTPEEINARVRRYRDDKSAGEADTVETVRRLHEARLG